jgi:UDP-N-acetylmuramoyl-L-alanyl-D-glutamate--2,6-diaminopimelate ligase
MAIVNLDDAYGARLLQELPDAWSYSLDHSEAAVRVRKAELDTTGITAELSTPRGPLAVRSALMGRLNLYNILAAATTALALGVPSAAIGAGLAAVTTVDGRLQRVPVPRELGWQVVVDYAHTPDAMEKSLSCLREVTRGRLVAVFGCGGDRDRGKRPLMGEVAAKLADLVVVTSDNPRSEVPEAIIAEIEPGVRAGGLQRFDPAGGSSTDRGYAIEVDRRRAIGLALELARSGDLVFIGGKGHETYQIVGGEVFPFDDRQVVRDWLSARTPGARARQAGR